MRVRSHPMRGGAALACLVLFAGAPASAQGGRWARLAASDALADTALAAYRRGRNAEAAPAFVRAAGDALADSRAGLLYNAACSFALSDQPDAAVRALDDAVRAGWENSEHLQSDTDLAGLHDRPEWAGLVARASTNSEVRRARRAAVDSVRIVADDIPRFWAAVDAAAPALAAHDTVAAAAVFERLYLDEGTDALLGYVRAKVPGGPRAYAVQLMRYPAYYASIRETTQGLGALGPEIRAALSRLTRLYPEASFPDVTFVVGALTAGGTSLPQGLLLGVEMNAAAADSPLGEMPDGLRGLIAPAAHLPHVVVHELVHANQHTSGAWTVLRAALIEGGADVLADLILPGAPEAHYTTWGRAHDRAVWARFMAEKASPDFSQWTANASARAADWTGDLGYYVGAEIWRGYLAQASDRAQAIRDLLEMRDPEAILAASGYADRYSSSRE